MRPIALLGALAFAGALACGGTPAIAAPQVLGVMASAAPIPLRCDRRECSAVIGTFCLQRDRGIPGFGAPYEAFNPERIALYIETADGLIHRLPGREWLRFAGYNGYTTARVILPRESLARLGGTAAAVTFGPGVSLVPLAEAGDDNPQSPDEISTATGALRAVAGRYLDRPSVQADAARLVMALLNNVPETRTIRDSNSGLWGRTVTEDLTRGMADGAIPIAERAYQRCSAQPNPRGCLIGRHRELMVPDNRRFWQDTSGF
jgi:hypothetical protein